MRRPLFEEYTDPYARLVNAVQNNTPNVSSTTVPAYLADVFGTKYVSAVHGRLLTAWSAAGVLGPVLVNYIRQFQIDHGIPKNQAYNITMYIMASLLVIALFANLAVRRVAARYHERTRPRQQKTGIQPATA